MRTETEFKLLPYLHSKFLGSEHVTFGQMNLPYKDGRKKAKGLGSQLPSLPLNSKVCLMTLFFFT